METKAKLRDKLRDTEAERDMYQIRNQELWAKVGEYKQGQMNAAIDEALKVSVVQADAPSRWVVMCTTHPLPLGDVEAWTIDEAIQKYLKVKAVCELVNSGAAPQFYVKTWDEVIGQANARVEPAQEMKIYKR